MERFDEQLRGDADAFRPEPSSELRRCIGVAIRSAELAPKTQSSRWDPWLVAAGLLLATIAFWSSATPVSPQPERHLVMDRLDDLFSLDGYQLVAQGARPLQAEAENLVADAERAMQGFVASLPLPFKKRFGTQ